MKPAEQKGAHLMLDLESRDGIAIVHMRQGLLSTALLQRLAAALEFIRGPRAVVLTGYRSTFAIDAETEEQNGYRADDLLVAQQAALRAMIRHPRPIVAAINGDALDTGFALAAAADTRLMARGLIGTTRPLAGTGPRATVVETISHAFGRDAQSMLAGGHTIGPAAAEAIGLVERATTPACLLDEAVDRARMLSGLHSAASA
ncbi:MAG: enoyl-CoA hydratase-related protein [Haloechinothrix sp.]